MSFRLTLTAAAFAALTAVSAVAQTTQPVQPARPAAPAQPARPATPTPPAQPARPATPAAPTATAPRPATPTAAVPAPAQGSIVNINTATEKDLDGLPQIGPARAKAIIESRTKVGRFKNWEDFVARNVVPKNAEDAIKARVRF